MTDDAKLLALHLKKQGVMPGVMPPECAVDLATLGVCYYRTNPVERVNPFAVMRSDDP